MLTSLSIRNVVLIESLDLEFGPGLSALTGETGAGKSIILDSLGMATGARSDRGLVRTGTERAQAIASFVLRPDSPIWAQIADADLDADPNQDLTLRRTVGADGRSRAYLNDQAVGVKLLSAIGSQLLEVHGQHDGRGLLNPSTHIHLLDLFAGNDPQLNKVAEAHADLAAARARLSQLETVRDKADGDRAFLEHAIAELDRLDPIPGEDVALAAERKFLQGAEGALTELTAAQDALGHDGSGEGDAFEQRLATALAGIERVRAKLADTNEGAAKALSGAADSLERAMLETEEARAAVADAARAFDVEPGRLDGVEERLFGLRAAARKFGTEVDQLVETRQGFAAELASIDSVDRDLIEAKAATERARETYAEAAAALRAARIKGGKALRKAVLSEMPPLKMERADFEVAVEDGPETASGSDKVRFRVSTNPGTPIGPLDKIASGGEMARFALAIKVALAGKTDAVMVFDEVDQGVGGAVANAVGKRLAVLSRTSQVLVVTHSPQVAASADHQFRIEKHSTGKVTTTEVTPVDAGEREEEIARMLAGDEVTKEARAAARQLMDARG